MEERIKEMKMAVQKLNCAACGDPSMSDDDYPWFCPDCQLDCPPSLLKAAIDPFDYALKLRTGEVLFFTRAEIRPGWVTLFNDVGSGNEESDFRQPMHDPGSSRFPIPACRGLDVRLDAIEWCADAPFGS